MTDELIEHGGVKIVRLAGDHANHLTKIKMTTAKVSHAETQLNSTLFKSGGVVHLKM